ncbi:MAG: CoA ester lyase [Rhizobiaceae bacterium]|nr:CoA ester lyase [Rhizobiaceae bacterium]
MGRMRNPRRAVLYVPASNEKAIAKVSSLACDAVIFDLEDAVAPAEKVAARERLRKWFAARPQKAPELIIRVNPLASEWGTEDLLAARACAPDAILLPKVNTPRDIHDFDDMLDESDAPENLKLWIMIETPKAMLNLGALAEFGRDRAARLDCFVAGTNDLIKETGVLATPDRRYIAPWLAHMVLAARAGGLDVLDGVSNDFRDLDAFERECVEASAMGFDGKTLIHPSQIEAALRSFSPSPEAIGEAEAVRAAFALPENAGKGVISMDGRMIERLHLAQAERLLARAGKSETKA